mmetsp:Transcript_26241/g.62367  ORF Transcript_26241/g.62367 Transcript_26241/m.62367 type:complete len:427 (+) Transcript_26241:287-1567(+)
MSDTFSPYQIDFQVKNKSKTFGFSKKQVSFKFGVANQQAINEGLTGANCRGSEHEVIFTWSLNSGKRTILADGKDVHYSETGQNGWTADQVFQHHFQIRVPGLSSPLRAHLITQPRNADDPRVKPFDLRVNGVSYFSMAKIFQLGTPQMITRPVKGGGGGGGHHRDQYRGGGGGGGGSHREENDAYLSPEERKAIAAAKLASLRDLNAHPGSGGGLPPAPAPAAQEVDLLDFSSDPVPAPVPPHAAPPANPNPVYGGFDAFGGGAPPPAPAPAAAYSQQPYANYSLGAPAPAPPQSSAFGTQQDSYMSSMSSMGSTGQYGGSMNFGAPPQPPAPAPAPFGAPPQQYYQQPPQPSVATAAAPFGAPPAQSLTSPSNNTYLSYGSAPSFAQPPQQQMPPQQQHQQPPPHQQHSYGAPYPPPQGYPQQF